MNRSLKFDLRQDTKTNITEVVGFFRYFRFSLKISWTLYVVRNTSDGAECHLENGVISKRLIDTNTWLCLLHWASVYHTGTFECVCVCARARAQEWVGVCVSARLTSLLRNLSSGLGGRPETGGVLICEGDSFIKFIWCQKSVNKA